LLKQFAGGRSAPAGFSPRHFEPAGLESDTKLDQFAAFPSAWRDRLQHNH